VVLTQSCLSLLDLRNLRVLSRGCYQDGDKMMRTVIDRLVIKGMEITSIPNYIRDLAYIISFNKLLSLQGLNRRLQLLGWDDFELDEHTFLLILVAFEYISVTNQLPVVDKFKFNKN
ncbi:MAG: hypothetical protein ACNYWU_10305, partial [Desulfobacterales bacterium]